MNTKDREVQKNRRVVKTHLAFLDDLMLEKCSLIERIENDALPEDGVATTREIYEGLGLDEGER